MYVGLESLHVKPNSMPRRRIVVKHPLSKSIGSLGSWRIRMPDASLMAQLDEGSAAKPNGPGTHWLKVIDNQVVVLNWRPQNVAQELNPLVFAQGAPQAQPTVPVVLQ